jgi:hypothetical protein
VSTVVAEGVGEACAEAKVLKLSAVEWTLR